MRSKLLHRWQGDQIHFFEYLAYRRLPRRLPSQHGAISGRIFNCAESNNRLRSEGHLRLNHYLLIVKPSIQPLSALVGKAAASIIRAKALPSFATRKAA